MSSAAQRHDSAPAPPTLSVVIPVRNGARTIVVAIESVFAACPWAEVVVVDDGSSDDSAGIVLERFGTRCEIIRAEGLGPSRARNIGARVARGEILAFLDADDALDLSWADCILPPFANPNVLMVSGLHRVVSPNRPPRIAQQELLTGIRINLLPGSFAIRRLSFIESGGFDEALRYSECTELMFRLYADGLAEAGRHVFIDSVVRTYNRDVVNKYSPELVATSAIRIIERHSSTLRELGALGTWLSVAAVALARHGDVDNSRRYSMLALRERPTVKNLVRTVFFRLPRRLLLMRYRS